SYTRSVAAGNPNFELRVTVTSGGLTATDTKLIYVSIPTPLTVLVTGPDYMIGGESGTWQAAVSGGTGSYTYQWQYKTASGTTWTNVGTASTYTRNAPLKASFYVRVTVTSGTVTATDEHYVTVEPVTIENPMCGDVYC
ncbi:MAG TPA: hypothetical protein VFR81_28540, partial [Longimicrobium sp.]|nr:hypothetical protein [Longimicrobium sp.]